MLCLLQVPKVWCGQGLKQKKTPEPELFSGLGFGCGVDTHAVLFGKKREHNMNDFP